MDEMQRWSGEEIADSDVEWAFSGAHDIEYWVVREGRLVPAESSDLERIAESERERAALPRLRQSEREGQGLRRRVRTVDMVARFVSWCRTFGPRTRHAYATELPTVESSGNGTPRRRSDSVPR